MTVSIAVLLARLVGIGYLHFSILSYEVLGWQLMLILINFSCGVYSGYLLLRMRYIYKEVM